MVTSGTILSGRYLIQHEVGAGGMGAVYEATDLRTGAQVAVKVLHPLYAHNAQFIGRLRREARIAASIRTPRAVRVIDLDDHEGMPYLVMEYVAGENLSDRLARRGALPFDEALNICIEITRALEGAYAVGVVHRDLKPQNVKITDEGEVKVLDFGIARAENLPGITGTDMFTGTPEYCAPERIDGQGDIRSDIYSLGVMLYEMLAGNRPFDGPTPFAVLRLHESATVPALPVSIPPEVQTVLERTLAKQPSDRFQTPYELMAALRAARDAVVQTPDGRRSVATTLVAPAPAGSAVDPTVQAPAPVVAPSTPPPTTTPAAPARRRAPRRVAVLAGGAVLALVAAGGIGYGITQRGGSRNTPTTAARAQTAAATPAPPATPSPSPAPTAAAEPAVAPLLLPGQKVDLDVQDEAPLPVCLGPDNRPQLKTILKVTSIERDAQDSGRVTVSFVQSVPRVPGVECPLGYEPDANGNTIALDTLQRTASQDRTYRTFSVDGTGLAVTGAANIYGRDMSGTWIFEGADLNGVELWLVQRLKDGRDLHRIKLLPK
jgi:hypothetical protein